MIIGLSLIVLFTIGCLWARSNEKKTWNKGICARTGKPWEYFDTDSQEGRGYKSEDQCCWISCPGIDKKE